MTKHPKSNPCRQTKSNTENRENLAKRCLVCLHSALKKVLEARSDIAFDIRDIFKAPKKALICPDTLDLYRQIDLGRESGQADVHSEITPIKSAVRIGTTHFALV